MYRIIHINDHVQVYDYTGKFLFSADTQQEAREEIRNYEESAA